MRHTHIPAPKPSKQPTPAAQRPEPQVGGPLTPAPASAPAPRPAGWPWNSLAAVPIFPPGTLATPAPTIKSNHAPQFFDAQAFSSAAAQQAVSGATAGRYPFGDRIRAETRGTVNPHAVPATVVNQLPGLGVCQDGKVALRQGAGIDVARHELAHALGGDEATADRAGRDPNVLTSLAGGTPVNGWKVGFEFQTWAGPNPKTFQKKFIRGEPAPLNEAEQEQDNDALREGPILSEYYTKIDSTLGNAPLLRKPDWKMEVDSGDLEVITNPLDETDAGRAKIITVMSEVEVEMKRVQNAAKSPHYLAYPVNGDTVYVQHKSGFKKFTSHPQATVGVHFESVPQLISRLTTQQKVDHPHIPNNKVWGRDQIGFDFTNPDFKDADSQHGMTYIHSAQQQVDAALAQHGTVAKFPHLRAILHILGSYAALGTKVQSEQTAQLKNTAAFMSRNNLHEVYELMSPAEKRLYAAMLAEEQGPGSMAAAFGLANLQTLGTTKLLRHGAMGWGQVTLGQILQNLPEVDIMGDTDSQKSIHKLNASTVRKYLSDADNQFDIGPSQTQGVQSGAVERKGLFLELRAIKRDVPWDQWKDVALSVFDLVRQINSGVENQKYQDHQQGQRQRQQSVNQQIQAHGRQQQLALERRAIQAREARERQLRERQLLALLNRPPPMNRGPRNWFFGD